MLPHAFVEAKLHTATASLLLGLPDRIAAAIAFLAGFGGLWARSRTTQAGGTVGLGIVARTGEGYQGRVAWAVAPRAAPLGEVVVGTCSATACLGIGRCVWGRRRTASTAAPIGGITVRLTWILVRPCVTRGHPPLALCFRCSSSSSSTETQPWAAPAYDARGLGADLAQPLLAGGHELQHRCVCVRPLASVRCTGLAGLPASTRRRPLRACLQAAWQLQTTLIPLPSIHSEAGGQGRHGSHARALVV